jgi:hypothetical protein
MDGEKAFDISSDRIKSFSYMEIFGPYVVIYRLLAQRFGKCVTFCPLYYILTSSLRETSSQSQFARHANCRGKFPQHSGGGASFLNVTKRTIRNDSAQAG